MPRAALGHAAVWVAVFCVYVQLLAAALCPAGAIGPTPGKAAFPICHAAVGALGHRPSDGQTPSPADRCPFCAIHCHAAVALTPTTKHPAPVLLAFGVIERASVSIPARPRRIAGASPRGPPARA